MFGHAVLTPRAPIVLLSVCLIAAVFASNPAPASSGDATTADETLPFVPDRVIVKLREEYAAQAQALPDERLPLGLAELEDICRRYGIEIGNRLVRERGRSVRDPVVFRRVGLDRVYVLRLPDDDPLTVKRLVRELSGERWVEYAEPVYTYEPMGTHPNDPEVSQQWQHQNTGQTGGTPDADMDSPDAWDTGTGDPSVLVAVIDTGVDLDHPDLVDNLVPGMDFTDSAEGVEDVFGHGTQVAGNVAARGNNGVGVAGICWTCSIIPVKIFGTGGFPSTLEEIAPAVTYSADQGADVLNMSFGGGEWSMAFIDAVDYAAGMGALSVGGSGNSGIYTPFPPAAFPNVVSVAGTDADDVRYGNYGDHAEVAAPTFVHTTAVDGAYGEFRGTSAACPLAAGLAGLLRATDPNLHVQELRQLLRLGAEDQVNVPGEDTPGWDMFLGYGRINAANSMALIGGPWLGLDRPHYVCAGTLFVDLKDTSVGSSVDVTMTGDIGGDVEVVIVTPVTAFGYYRGSIPLSWADVDGPVVPGDGKLDVTEGETVTAVSGY